MNYGEIIENSNGKSPIWYASFDYKVLKSFKTVKRSYTHHTSPKIVCKGAIAEMLQSDTVKSRIVESFIELSGVVTHKKIASFEIDRITLKEVHIDHFKGYGVKNPAS